MILNVFISLFDLITDGIVVSHHTQRKEEKLIILVVPSVISIELLAFVDSLLDFHSFPYIESILATLKLLLIYNHWNLTATIYVNMYITTSSA